MIAGSWNQTPTTRCSVCMLPPSSSRVLLDPLLLESFAPLRLPCPTCGELARRNEVREMTRQGASLDGPAEERVLVGCYLCANCPAGERWFRVCPPGFEGRSRYTSDVRKMVLRLTIDYKMSFEAAAHLSRTLFNLPKLNPTTIMRWQRQAGEQVDLSAHLRARAEAFSGQLAIDEVYDAPFWVVRVTDPINKVEVLSVLGRGDPTADDIADILCDLRDAGFKPDIIVTDASSLYPSVLAEIFPNARHQLCVFHFLQGMNKALGKMFRAIVASMPKPKKRKRGRPPKRGRPRKDKEKKEAIETVKACRYLVFQRDGIDVDGQRTMSDEQRERLREAIDLCPALGELRAFVEAVHGVFERGISKAQARARRDALLADPKFAAMNAAKSTLNALKDAAQFAKLTVSLDFANADRTSNHAERENRDFRKRQKSHYCLRTARSMRSFLRLMTTRRPSPEQPERLQRRQTPSAAEPTTREVASV